MIIINEDNFDADFHTVSPDQAPTDDPKVVHILAAINLVSISFVGTRGDK
jgi:hypothetical protein